MNYELWKLKNTQNPEICKPKHYKKERKLTLKVLT